MTGRIFLLLFFLLYQAGANAQELNCNDGVDNDGDGLTDCFDGDCIGTNDCKDFYWGQPVPEADK